LTQESDVLQANADTFRLLCFDWFRKFARDAKLTLEQYGSSGLAYTLGAPESLQITAKFIPERPYLKFESNDAAHDELVQELAREAIGRTEAGDFGGVVWYSSALIVPAFQMALQFGMGAFLEQLGNQTRIVGWRRLGGHILMLFTEELPPDLKEGVPALAPKAVVHVHVAVPAPCEGDFASRIAHGALETVGAICTFAFMRAVELPPAIFPTKPELLPEMVVLYKDQSLGNLARKSVSLDVVSQISSPGGLDHFARLRAAFLTFDAAIQQRHDLVACVLYVVVAECLVTPNTKWKDAKVTTRFVEFYDELMPSAIDELVAHGNLESLFPIKRGARNARRLRRELLSFIYEFRSGHVHQGLRPSYRGFGASGAVESVRRGFFAEFAERAILEYLKSPRCSYVGHPAYSASGSEPLSDNLR
jgi:uncharacterized membrane protein